ncbi:hypothetical protein [Cupriavidus taiwanensis]
MVLASNSRSLLCHIFAESLVCLRVDGWQGATMPPADFALIPAAVKALLDREPSENDVASYLMYPNVYANYVKSRRLYEDLSVLPTPVFFYGMQEGGRGRRQHRAREDIDYPTVGQVCGPR